MSVQRYVSPDLTHFVGRSLRNREGRYRLLRRILRSGVLKAWPKPRGLRVAHVLLKDTDKHLSSNAAYYGSGVCFCDIPVGDLALHMRKYSPFGLAFRKDFLAEQGALPVLYVPAAGRPSLLPFEQYGRGRVASQGVAFDVFWRHWNRLIEAAATWADARAREDLDRVMEFLEVNILSHLKFFDHHLPDLHPKNYYLEREWRVSRDVQFDLEEVQRIIVPPEFSRRLRKDFPTYDGEIVFAEL